MQTALCQVKRKWTDKQNHKILLRLYGQNSNKTNNGKYFRTLGKNSGKFVVGMTWKWNGQSSSIKNSLMENETLIDSLDINTL